MPDPNTATGNDTRPDPRPIYCYAIRQTGTEDGEAIFLTSWEEGLEIEGMPVGWGATDPQEFSYANVSHSKIKKEAGLDRSAFQLSAITEELGEISRFALTASIPKYRVDVIKLNSGPVLAGQNPEWGEDTFIVQSGLISKFGFAGRAIAIEVVPTALFGGAEIPRCRWSRTCNHVLYGEFCKADSTDHTLVGNVLATTPAERKILIAGQHLSDAAGGYFRQGVATHQASGDRLSIFASEPSGGDTLITVHQWQPEIEVGDVFTLRAGCDHLFATCQGKFANAANFGGFSGVPGSNPTFSGI